jgi:asparaginyl-tRNA synthetase
MNPITFIKDIKNIFKIKGDASVKITGWVHRIRKQGKRMRFLVIRDGTGFAQALMLKDIIKNNNECVSLLCKECCIEITGILTELPSGKTAPNNCEIKVTGIKLISVAEPIEEVNEHAGSFIKLNERHLVIREERTTGIIKLNHFLIIFLREYFENSECYEVIPPMITQQSVEGGATLFKLDYYGEEAVLTQSSQLYLETVLPSLGRAYCI